MSEALLINLILPGQHFQYVNSAREGQDLSVLKRLDFSHDSLDLITVKGLTKAARRAPDIVFQEASNTSPIHKREEYPIQRWADLEY